jgi:hypothetical protein
MFLMFAVFQCPVFRSLLCTDLYILSNGAEDPKVILLTFKVRA